MRKVMTMVAAIALATAPACGGKKDGGGEGAKKDEAPKAAHPSDDDLKKLLESPPEGYDKSMGGRPMGGTIMPMYTAKEANANKVKPQIMGMIAKCNFRICPKEGFNAANLEKNKDKLPHTMMLSKMHKENKDMVHEFKDAEIDGKKVVTVWLESYAQKGGSTSGSRSFTIYWSNGTTFVKSTGQGFGTARYLTPKEKWLEVFTKEEAQKAAEVGFKHFTKGMK